MPRRVVITACSAITPIGRTKQELMHSLTSGISGVRPLRDDGLLTWDGRTIVSLSQEPYGTREDVPGD
jgi:3-oxoacyl-(acyl-carrier-protein) synthase